MSNNSGRGLQLLHYLINNTSGRSRGILNYLIEKIPDVAIPKKLIKVPTIWGFDIYIDPSNNSLERCIFLRGAYEISVSSSLVSLLPKVDVFWDIGAHIGYYALLGSHFMKKGGQVVAFEPHPEVYKLLQRNINAFAQNKVLLLQIGLDQQDCQKTIYDKEEHSRIAPTFMEGIFDNSRSTCQLRSADSLLASGINGYKVPKPDVIKMDIEGYEIYAVRGMKELIASSAPPILIFELNEHFYANVTDILQELMALNNYEFLIEKSINEISTKRSPADGPTACFKRLDMRNIPPQCNVIAFSPKYHKKLLSIVD